MHLCEQTTSKPNVRIVWFDLPKTKTFDKEDYALFTNKRNFGTIYSSYADVGKGIESLVDDEDNHHHDFVPNLHYSADCRIIFETLSDKEVTNRENKYKEYQTKNQIYFDAKGYYADDVRLTTGHIPLATLNTTKSEQQILQELSKYDLIQDLSLIHI